MQNYLIMIKKFGNEILEFFGINEMLKISFKNISFIVAAMLGIWSHITDQFWPISIIFWSYVLVLILCWLRAFAHTCGEVEDLKQQIADRENKEKFVTDMRPVMNQVFLSNPMNMETPLYNKALMILENNRAVSKVWIDIFKNDESLREKFDSMHSSSELRLRLLNQLINSFLPN